jgi:uncharacterized protein YegL
MPKYKDDDTAIVKHNAGHFGFSAVQVTGNLLDNEYTLVTVVVDRSGSTSGFQQAMEGVLKEIVEACRNSPRADNLLLRVVTFSDDTSEFLPWTLLTSVNADQFDGSLPAGGWTALHDATINGVEGLSNFGRTLIVDHDYKVNGIVFVITDGEENKSKFKDVKYVRSALAQTIKGENLESCVSVLIAVNNTDPAAASALKEFNEEAGFTHFIDLKDASKKTLEKVAKFVSDSISSQSQALGSGGPSKAINPSVVF